MCWSTPPAAGIHSPARVDGLLRFAEVPAPSAGSPSQMLAQTLHRREADGLVSRDTVFHDPATLGLRLPDSAEGPGARIPYVAMRWRGSSGHTQGLAGSQRRHHQVVPAWRMMSRAWQAQLRQWPLTPPASRPVCGH
jgi:hypothetical protein